MSDEHLIYAVSDSTGETAEQTVRAALAQFRPRLDVRILVFGRVRDEESARGVIERAKADGALLVYTLVEGTTRARIKELAVEKGVPAVDLLSGLIHAMSRHLDRKPLSVAGLGHETDAAYFRRIEAVEFTVRHDDGRLPEMLDEAEIVLVGVSRTSKTPLSNYIAQRGYRVANVPIVKGIPPPQQLLDLDPRRVFALVIDPRALALIRQRRMEIVGLPPESSYGDPDACRDEILWARRIFRDHPDWIVLDITDRAIEETTAAILQIYRGHFEPPPAVPAPRKAAGTRAKRKKKAARTSGRKGRR